MNVMKQFRKLGVVVAMSSMLALVAPVIVPAYSTTMVSAATVKLSKTKLTLITGKSKTLKVTGSKETVKWSSSDKSVAKVSSKGKVTAVSTGTATITAKVGKKKLTCKVTVKPYEEEKLVFNCGAEFLIPKGWKTEDQNIASTETKLIYDDANQSQYLMAMVTLTGSEEKLSPEDFISLMNSQLSKENLEGQIEQQITAAGGKAIDLHTDDYTCSNSIDGDIAVLCTYAQYSVEGEPIIGMMIYDICDGYYIYQISAYNNDCSKQTNIYDIAGYMAENISIITE